MNSANSIISPQLNILQQELAVGNLNALDRFWQEIRQRGTPLVETIENDDNHVLVTFLWRADEDIGNVVVVGQLGTGQSFIENQMNRLPNTNLWFKTYKLPNDLRAAYCLSPNDSLIPFHQVEDWVARTLTWQPDPLNPHHLKVPEHKTFLSVLELPSAPPQSWLLSVG